MSKYPGKLQHQVPGWVERGALFHIRIRRAAGSKRDLTEESLGSMLLETARFYHEQEKWFARICLLMPDHIHAILGFPNHELMSTVVGRWKSYHARTHAVSWQDNYFDHRLRDDEEVRKKTDYILMNPVAKALCAAPADWPWVYIPGHRGI